MAMVGRLMELRGLPSPRSRMRLPRSRPRWRGWIGRSYPWSRPLGIDRDRHQHHAQRGNLLGHGYRPVAAFVALAPNISAACRRGTEEDAGREVDRFRLSALEQSVEQGEAPSRLLAEQPGAAALPIAHALACETSYSMTRPPCGWLNQSSYNAERRRQRCCELQLHAQSRMTCQAWRSELYGDRSEAFFKLEFPTFRTLRLL